MSLCRHCVSFPLTVFLSDLFLPNLAPQFFSSMRLSYGSLVSCGSGRARTAINPRIIKILRKIFVHSAASFSESLFSSERN